MKLRCELEEEVGAGGQGTVHRGRLDGRLVAVKVMRPRGEKGARLAREANVLARLPSHPNVRAYLGVEVQETGEVHLIQEWVEGVALDSVLDAGRLPIHAALYIIHEVLTALAECVHPGGVVHRDLSPANILISADGSVKLADFGIAKSLQGPATTGGLRGTLAYLSPEQAREDELTTVSDLFPVGTLCYELLTGRLPVEGTDKEIQSRLIDARPLPSPRVFASWIPDELDNIIGKLLAKDPAQRYQTAAEVLADLPAVYLGQQSLVLALEGLGICPVPKQEPEPPVALPERPKWLRSVALGAVAVLGSVALVAAGAHLGGDRASGAAAIQQTSPAVGNVDSVDVSAQDEKKRSAAEPAPLESPTIGDETEDVGAKSPLESLSPEETQPSAIPASSSGAKAKPEPRREARTAVASAASAASAEKAPAEDRSLDVSPQSEEPAAKDGTPTTKARTPGSTWRADRPRIRGERWQRPDPEKENAL